MPKILLVYVRYVESANKRLGKILGVGIFVLLGILIIEGISRFIFNTPTPWSMEMSLFVLGGYFLLSGGYVLLHNEHVRMDALYSRWSLKKKAIADIATFCLFAVYFVVFIIGGIDNTAYSVKFSQHSSSLWGPPLAPIKIIMMIGACLFLIQAVALFIRDLYLVRGRELR